MPQVQFENVERLTFTQMLSQREQTNSEHMSIVKRIARRRILDRFNENYSEENYAIGEIIHTIIPHIDGAVLETKATIFRRVETPTPTPSMSEMARRQYEETRLLDDMFRPSYLYSGTVDAGHIRTVGRSVASESAPRFRDEDIEEPVRTIIPKITDGDDEDVY